MFPSLFKNIFNQIKYTIYTSVCKYVFEKNDIFLCAAGAVDAQIRRESAGPAYKRDGIPQVFAGKPQPSVWGLLWFG
jgi:hypothetical protein